MCPVLNFWVIQMVKSAAALYLVKLVPPECAGVLISPALLAGKKFEV